MTMAGVWTKALGFLGGWQGYALAAALAVALAVPTALKLQAMGYDVTLATERAARAAEKQTQADAAREAEETHRTLEAALWARIAAIQAQSEKEAEDAKAERDKFVADYDAGRVRLWIEGRCPAAAFGSTAAGSAAAQSCDDAPVELSRTAAETYSDLKAAIDLDQRTIRACQADAAAVRGAFDVLLQMYLKAKPSGH